MMTKREDHSVGLRPHWLEPAAIAAFKEQPCQDRVTLADAFKERPGVSTDLRPNRKTARLGMNGNRAYLVVAEDVLLYMESQGKITKDECGWYRLGGLPR